MKKTLASLLAALTLVGPLPLYAQSIPQVAGVGTPVGTVGAAGAVAGPNTFSQGPLTSVSLGNTVLTQATVLRTAPTGAGALAGKTAAGNSAAAAVAVGPSNLAVAGKSEVRAQAVAASESRNETKTSMDVVRGLAGVSNPKASAAETSAAHSSFFDALGRAKAAGAPAAEETPETPAVNATLKALGQKIASSAFGRLLPAGLYSKLAADPNAEPPAPKPANPNVDAWGGPKSEPMTMRQQALYGLKWAFNLIGITTVLSLTLGAVLAVVPWPVYLPETLLHMSGRVELLINYGPKAISEALANAPLSFLFFKIPLAVASEEFSFRFVSFAQTFLTLAAIRPIANWFAEKLGALPDLFRIPTIGKKLLGRAAGLSKFAFPLAAASSALSFAAAHIGEWGVDPFVLIVQGLAGLVLVRTAYVSRGLVAPFVAHLSFTFLTLLAPMLLMNGFVGAGAMLSMGVGIAGVVALYYNWRVHHKLAKLAKGGPLALFLAALIGWQAMGPTPSATQAAARFSHNAPVAVQMQQAPAPQAPQAPQEDPHQGLPPEIAEMLKQALGATFGGPVVVEDKTPDLSTPEIVQKNKPASVMVKTQQGLGSGFIVSKDGRLITNAHVVKSVGKDGRVMIVFENGMQVPGKVLDLNEQMDVAIVQLPTNPKGWPTVELAPVGSLVEGQKVITMGHPLGLPFTVSEGIVSGLGYRGIGLPYRIQITAPISHGNSGGMLVDTKGRVVGINSAGIEQGSNLGFSIPVEEINRALEQYAKNGAIRSAHLGIIVQIGERMAQGPGATIEYVRPGSPAEKAGLMAGDIIAGADHKRFPPAAMPALNALFQNLGAKNPGDTLELLVLRPQASGAALPQVVKVTVDAK
ncbi:MAG: trypsin-like peptidase domain-containing protein [Elusimicrobia bacterium]|nr:trypsin-like peptidase domain-containing protein [Elusimicrobiota bacterium]